MFTRVDRYRWLFISATVATAAIPSWAQSKLAPVSLKSAPELARRVELQEVGTPVANLLARLSRQSGVSLATDDPVIGDQKVILHADLKPLGALLDEVAELLSAIWIPISGGRDDKKAYRMVRSPQRLMEIEQYRRQEAERAGALRRGRLKRYSTVVRLALKSVRRTPTTERSVERPCIMPFERLVPVLGQLSSRQIEQLIQQGDQARQISLSDGPRQVWGCGRMVKAPVFALRLSELPKVAREGVLDTLRLSAAEVADLPPVTGRSAYAIHAEDPELMLHFANFNGDGIFLCTTSARMPGTATEFQIIAGLDAIPSDPTLPVNQGLTAEERKAVAEYIAGRYGPTPSPLPNRPGRVVGLSAQARRQPFLVNLRELLPDEAALAELSFPGVLLAVHRATGRTVLADYFTKPQRLPLSQVPSTMGELLSTVCARFGRNAWAGAVGLRFRSTTWLEDEPAEVPGRLLSPWLEAVNRLGSLPADAWLEMGRLTIPQLCSLATPSDRFGDVLVQPARSALLGYDALQVYCQLTPAQQAAARREPLRWQDLAAAQREFVESLAVLNHGLHITREALPERFHLSVGVALTDKELQTVKPRMICGLSIRLSQQLGMSARLMSPGQDERFHRQFAAQ
jgi:hypothetical protein